MNFKFLLIALLSVAVVMGCKDRPTVTPSGYDFKFLTNGSGKEVTPDSYVYFTLEIKDENGKVLQSMGEGPNMPIMFVPKEKVATDEPNPVLDVLEVSRVGDVIVLTMPVDSIPNAPADIKDMKYIEYIMTIVNVTDKAGYDKYMSEMEETMNVEKNASMEKLPAIEELVKNTIKDYTSNALKTTSTNSGLKYYIIENGEGEKVASGQTVSVHYYGSLINGTQFDNSFTRGQSFAFTAGAGQVIKGWDEGIMMMNKGSKGFFFVPAELGYGAQDSPMIPPNSELVFYVEVVDIK
ncbi:MAG: FKBP-type peptidyl-prolyl cis-trans isomerase [Saprospiraceae bacterium]